MKALKGGWKKARVKETSTSSITLLDEITSDSELLIFADKVTTFKPTEVVTGTGTTNTLDIFGDGSCIACYPFDGNAKDLSGKYNGTWHRNEQYDVGKFGQAAKFDGSNCIVVSPSPIVNLKTSDFSITFWFKPQNNSSVQEVIVFENKSSYEDEKVFSLRVDNSQLGYWFEDDSDNNYCPKVVPISLNQWYFIAFFKSGNDANLRIYNTSHLLKNYNFDINNIFSKNIDELIFGAYYETDSYDYIQRFIGLIDQVRIFNRALTEEEIQILYNEYEKIYQTDISSLNLSAKPKRVYIQTNPAIYISKTFNQDTSQPDWVSYQANLKEKLKEISIDTTQTTTTQLVTTDDIALNDKLILYNNSDGIKEITVTQDNLIYDVENDVVKVDISSLNLTQPPTKCFKNPTKISIAFGEDVNTNTYQPQEVEKREFNPTDNTITTTFKRFYDVDKAGRQFKVKLEGYCDTEVNELKVNLWTQETSK